MSPFVPKDWVDSPSTQTPISAAALEDLEARVAAYTDTRFAAGDPSKQSLFVSKQGSDSTGNGFSWTTSYLTIGRALQALGTNPGVINVGPGTFREAVTLGNEGQNIVGATRRFIIGTVLEAPSATSDILTVTATDCRVENLQFQGLGATWNAVALNVQSGGYLSARQLKFRHGAGFATSTVGGTAIKIVNAEGFHFDDVGISEFRLGIDIDNGANQGIFFNTHCSGNWMDLWTHDSIGGNNPGGNHFYRFKSVYCKSDNPILLDTTSNGQFFIGADWSESPVTNHIDIRSHHNTFIIGSTSPQATWNVYGNNNHLHHIWVANTLNVTGNNNYIARPHLVGAAITISGTGNFLENPSKPSGTITVNAGNFIENTEGVAISGTGYRRRAYFDEITGGGGSAHTILDETTALTQRTGLAFQGAGVTASDDSGNNRTVVTIPGGGGGTITGSSTAPTPSVGMVFNDVLTPVTADGAGMGISQQPIGGSGGTRFFVINGNYRQVVGIHGSDVLNYPAGGVSSMIKAAVAVWLPGSSVWAPGTSGSTTADQDRIYGHPGVAAWDTRLGFFGATAYRRLRQRWYKIPGVPDALFLELFFSIDATATDGTATGSKSSGSGASPWAPRFDLMLETQTFGASAGVQLAYDSTLDGIAFMNGSPGLDGADYTYHFIRCLSDPSTGYFYDDAASPDSNQNFGTGALPGGSTYTTLNSKTYRAHLSMTAANLRGINHTVRYVVGVGTSIQAAKNAVRNVPNCSPDQTIEYYESKVASLPSPANLTASETRSWKYFAVNPILNTRTEQDWHPEQVVWDGISRRLPFNGLGRWNAIWTFDTAIALMGWSAIDPGMVRDFLDYILNKCMNQSNGFMRRDPTVTNETSMGNFFLARLARRYLACTGDSPFVTALYPKLQLLYNWWTVTASSAYRHPNWPSVKLLTASNDRESQEVSPVSTGGNYPAGDDWVTAAAYDYAVHMAYLASVTGHGGDTTTWNNEATAYRNAIRTYCWDAGQGWFQPVMTPSSPNGGQGDSLGRFNKIKTYRAFGHLYYGTASPAMAAVMRAKIMDSTFFLGTFGVRTVDAHGPGYLPNDWVNGASRPYYDAQVSCGLRRYGFNSDADIVLQKWVDRQNAVGTTPEATNPDNGTGGFSRFLVDGLNLTEAMIAKHAPSMLGVDSGSSTAIGLDAVTS